jgi:hypothetical protein
MWKGAFSPNLTKLFGTHNGVEVYWAPLPDKTKISDLITQVDEKRPGYAPNEGHVQRYAVRPDYQNPPESAKQNDHWNGTEMPGNTVGICWVKFSSKEPFYAIAMTFADYLDWKQQDFSRGWLDQNYDLSHNGDWAWPWGRDHSTVVFIEDQNGGHWVTIH